MIPASSKQKQRIAILTKNDKELKAAYVVQQTKDDSKHSTNDLSHSQANTIITQLGGKPLVYDNWAFFDKYDRSHSYIRSLCIQYGWTALNSRHSEIADLGRLSEWLKNQAPVKKRLLNMTRTEVSKTISALENMVKKSQLKQS